MNEEHHINPLTPFLFGENTVRTIVIKGQPWFVTSDICTILGLENHSQAIITLDDDEKGVTISDSLGGPQKISIISEMGLYRLIFKSRKAAALEFQRWVFHEVLPAIRRSGSYSPGQIAFVGFVRELIGLGCSPNAALRAALRQSPLAAHGRGPVLMAEPETPFGDDAVFLVSLMEPGREYGTDELSGIIPDESRLGRKLAGLTPRGRQTKLGKLIGYCAKRGLVERDGGSKLGKYTLPPNGENIVAIR